MKRESEPPSQAIEPVLMPANISGVNNPPNNASVNHTSSTWPMYDWRPGYVLLVATQGMVGLFLNIYNNPIYQNLQYANTIMANMPIFGAQTNPYSLMTEPLYMGLVGDASGTSSTNPTTNRQGNVWPIFPNMPRTFPMATGAPLNTVESLATLRQ